MQARASHDRVVARNAPQPGFAVNFLKSRKKPEAGLIVFVYQGRSSMGCESPKRSIIIVLSPIARSQKRHLLLK
jgi:hypothetical protein